MDRRGPRLESELHHAHPSLCAFQSMPKVFILRMALPPPTCEEVRTKCVDVPPSPGFSR